VDITDACGIIGLTVGKFSHGGWNWNEANGLDDILDLTGSKLSHGGWSCNEADGLHLLLEFLA
jgi:hypothetical protein